MICTHRSRGLAATVRASACGETSGMPTPSSVAVGAIAVLPPKTKATNTDALMIAAASTTLEPCSNPTITAGHAEVDELVGRPHSATRAARATLTRYAEDFITSKNAKPTMPTVQPARPAPR